MTDKAYIVTNEQQEREVLKKVERDGFTWFGGDKPTENKPSNWYKITIFPYIIFVGKNIITWNPLSKLEDEEIVYDGRKESKMKISKMKISKEVYDALVEWRDGQVGEYINAIDLKYLKKVVLEWWLHDVSNTTCNNHLIAIIRWVNGEDVFEVEKPKKWVVRSKDTDTGNDYVYLTTFNTFGLRAVEIHYGIEKATKFDTKEEAESWANAHQEVVEVEE